MLCDEKYHEPYTPEMVVWIVFLSHSEIQYMANVTKTVKPMTLPWLQPLVRHDGLFWSGV